MSTFTGHIHGAAIIFDWADLFRPSSLPICLSACVLSLSDRQSLQTFCSGACLAKKLRECGLI